MTDYGELARRLIQQMLSSHKFKPLKEAGEGLHGGAFVLQFIRNQEESLPKEISDAMGVSSARIATALNDLEGKGLITREIDTSDRRKIIVRTTEKGKEVAEENMQNLLKKIEAMLRLLGEDDAREYVRIMGRLAEIMQIDECNAERPV